MTMTAPLMKKKDFVRTIFDCFAQDDFFKDVVLMVGGEQLAYHSQILRNVFPFLKNFIPNPGSLGPCEAFMLGASSIVITLDGVSPSTVSTLMSSIYNQQKPTYLNEEETEKVKELLEMLGADSRKYNFSLNTSSVNSSVQTDNVVTRTVIKANELDSMKVNVDGIEGEELLLNENLNERRGEAIETVNEADIEDWKRDGSFSATVAQEDEASDLDESVEDEEITFSIDASQLEEETDEHLPNHDDSRSSSSHEGQVQDSGVSVLSMVEQFMNEDAATKAPESKDHPDENLAIENVSTEHQLESNENEDMDEDIEVIAEVVDGVTEVVTEASEHSNEIASAFEASPVKKNEISISVQCDETVDLEVVIEEQLDDVQEIKEINPSEESAGSVNLVDEIKDSLNDEQKEETIGTNIQSFEVNEESGDNVNETEQDAVNEGVMGDCRQPIDLDEQRTKFLDVDELASVKPSIECNVNQIDDHSDDDDFTEDEDDELIEDEDDEEMNVACAMENVVTDQDVKDDADSIPGEDAEFASRKRKISEDEQKDVNQKKEKFAKSSPSSSLQSNETKSDDSDDEDFDLESLSAPLEDVKRVKRDLSESFEFENDEDDSSKSASEPFVLRVKASNVIVSFKGDDLEMMTDISTVEKKTSINENELDTNKDEVIKANADEESCEDDISLKRSLSGEDVEVDSKEGMIKKTNDEESREFKGNNSTYKKKNSRNHNEELDTEEDKVKKSDEELDKKENKIKKTKDNDDDDEVDLSNGDEDDESSEIEGSFMKNSLGHNEIKEKDSLLLGKEVLQGDSESTSKAEQVEVDKAEVCGSSGKEDKGDDDVGKTDIADEDEVDEVDDTEERAEAKDNAEDDYDKGEKGEAADKEEKAEAEDIVSEQIADEDEACTLSVRDDSEHGNNLASEDGLEKSLAGGEDSFLAKVEGNAKETVVEQGNTVRQSDNDEDADLFNIDEDDVDMLNKQTEQDTSEAAVDDNIKELEDKKGEKSSDGFSAVSKVDAPSKDSLDTTDTSEYHNIGTEAAAASTNCSKSDKLKLEPSASAPEQPKPAPTNTEEAVAVSDPPGLSCPLCPTQPPFKRGQLLSHLTDKHYSRDLQQRFPWTEGASCQMCVDTSRAKITISKTKGTYAKHVGTVHEKVLDLVPIELREAVLAVSKTRKSIIATIKEPEADGLEVVGVQKQELAGGNEVNTIKEECVEADNMEVDANGGDEISEAGLESSDEKVIEAKGLKSGQCPFCPNTKTQFQRSSLLNHLSSTHYNKQLLDAFPYQEGETCKLCLETGRQNPLIAKSKPRYVNHMGSLHEKVLDLLPPNVKENLEVAKKIPARTTRKSVSSKDVQDTVSSLPSHATVPGPSSSRGRSSAGPTTASTRAPAPGPPGPPLTRSLPKSLTVSAVPEDRLTSMGNVSISKVKEKKVSLPKLANVSISKIE